MNAWRFAVRSLRRQWRSGELAALLVAVVIAVAALSSVGFFADRVEQALRRQAAELIAADLLVNSSTPAPAAWLDEAHRRGLRTARTLEFPSVVLAGAQTHLAAVKAVSSAYPLRGHLKVAERPYGPATVTRRIPAPGTAWADPRLFRDLHLRAGTVIQVGAAHLKVTRILAYEPDRGGQLFNIAPRLLINLDDIASTRLIQRGSRVRYGLLVAGPAPAVHGFRSWIKARLGPGQHLQSLEDARPELRTALDRGHRFLGLAALVSVLLAGVAVAIGARRYGERQLDNAAMLRCLGAQQSWISRVYLLQLTGLGLGAGVLGVACGFAAQYGLAAILTNLVGHSLPAPGPLPVLTGVLAGLALLYGFGLPPLLRLKRVPPARVLRRELGPAPPTALAVYGSALALMTGLALWQAGDLRLTLYFLGGTAITLAGLGLAGWVLVRALSGLRRRVGVAWRFGLANIVRRAGTSTVQLLGIGIGIMALLLLTLIRTDLLADWRHSLPPDAPNQFAINVQTEQLTALRQFFHRHGLPVPTLYPMVRGRLTAINGRPLDPRQYTNQRAHHLAEREFNLSWATRVEPGNRVATGHWWGDAVRDHHQFSVEAGIAKTLGIRLGDRLTYQVAGQSVQGKVTSLRHVQWDTFRPNFFVLTPPGLLKDYPTTWICSFHLPSAVPGFVSTLVRAFPNVTVIDVDALMHQIRGIMDRVALAVEYLFAFTLAAGLLVLYTAIEATRDQRLYETAVLRTLGAGRRQLLQGLLTEFVTLGLLAGLLAALGASLVGYLIAAHLLDLSFQIRPVWWLAGMLGGGLGVGLAGLLATRSVLRQPPLQTLRRL